MKEEIVYVSGPYRGKTKTQRDINIEKAREAGIKLWEMDYVPLVPHLNTERFDDYCNVPDENYLEGDLILLKRCDSILMIKGWEKSQGALIELEFAKKNGLKVYYSLEEIGK